MTHLSMLKCLGEDKGYTVNGITRQGRTVEPNQDRSRTTHSDVCGKKLLCEIKKKTELKIKSKQIKNCFDFVCIYFFS